MPRPFWSGRGGSTEEEPPAYGHPKTLQDGLLQIGSQACHILVHRIDSAAAEAIRGHHRRGSSGSFRHHHASGPGRALPTDAEQYVVLLPPATPSVDRATKSPLASSRHPSSAGTSNRRLVREPGLTSPAGAPPKVPSSTEDIEQWGSRFLLRSEEDLSSPHFHSNKWNSRSWCKPSCVPITMILILIVLVVLLPLLEQAEQWNELAQKKLSSSVCSSSCSFSYVESIPEGVEYPITAPKYPSTFETWSNLINISQSTIEIASLYWSLRGADVHPHPSAYQGEFIFSQFMDASIERGIKLRIAQNAPSPFMPNLDTELLEKKGLAEVRSLNFAKLMGAGVLHTKFWIVDRRHVYVGSANMDWRSLTQVKEMGAVIYDCPCMANDMAKIFDVYWDLGTKDAVIPDKWPDKYSTPYNVKTPLNVSLNGTQVNTFLSSSPPPFCPSGRTGDSEAIVDLINKAEKFVYIAVMDYVPLRIYEPKVKFWPVFDDAIRAAAINQKVHVRLLVSHWQHTHESMLHFLRSLREISDSYKDVKIEVKLFTVPATPDQSQIPFARVNHNKYMVTDNGAYVGTSNWSGDYFINTAGVGLVIQPQQVKQGKQGPLPIRNQLQAVFERDWNSQYASYLTSPNSTLKI